MNHRIFSVSFVMCGLLILLCLDIFTSKVTHASFKIPTATPRIQTMGFATPTPATVGHSKVVVAVAKLNVRTCAGLNCQILGHATYGDCFTVMEQTRVGAAPWYRVRDSRNQTGWIAGPPYSALAPNCSTQPPTRTPPVSQACLPLKNHFNMEATITMTGEGREWTFQVQPKQTHTECFAPGDYKISVGIGEYRGNFERYFGPGVHPVEDIYREF